jgi:hypothetical protein
MQHDLSRRYLISKNVPIEEQRQIDWLETNQYNKGFRLSSFIETIQGEMSCLVRLLMQEICGAINHGRIVKLIPVLHS